jgi:general secretion pathway protein F
MDLVSDIKLKPKEVLDFTEQLDSFVSASMTLDQSLEKLREIYEEGSPDKPVTKMITEIQFQVVSGKKFSEALACFPRTFSRFFVSMIGAGELTGNLAEILHHLMDYLKREDELKSEVKGALTYPVVLVCLGLGVTTFLLISVVPRFEKMFQSVGQALPIYTQVLLSFSRFLTSVQGFIAACALAGAIYGCYRYLQTDAGRQLWDVWILRMPLLGDLMRKTAVARFTLTLGVLLKSQVEMISALAIGQGVVGNKVLEEALADAALRVNSGENMSPSLRGIFPLKAVQMLEVGEANAQLAEMSFSVALRYSKEVRDQLKIVTSVVEPLLLVVLGGMVCFIALAIFLPMMTQPQF